MELDRTGYGSCDLFYSQNDGKQWSKPVNLGPKINTRHWETQPSFSSDGKTLYFIRGLTYNRQRRNPDNQDIYVTTIMKDGNWSKPKKLASKYQYTLSRGICSNSSRWFNTLFC
jgi:Tol biopolymer transport system component